MNKGDRIHAHVEQFSLCRNVCENPAAGLLAPHGAGRDRSRLALGHKHVAVQSLDFTDASGVYGRLCRPCPTRRHLGEHLRHDAGAVGGVRHHVGVFDRCGERLVHKQVLAGFDRFHGNPPPSLHVGAVIDNVNVVPRQSVVKRQVWHAQFARKQSV